MPVARVFRSPATLSRMASHRRQGWAFPRGRKSSDVRPAVRPRNTDLCGKRINIGSPGRRFLANAAAALAPRHDSTTSAGRAPAKESNPATSRDKCCPIGWPIPVCSLTRFPSNGCNADNSQLPWRSRERDKDRACSTMRASDRTRRSSLSA
jgi:hypothetical protein